MPRVEVFPSSGHFYAIPEIQGCTNGRTTTGKLCRQSTTYIFIYEDSFHRFVSSLISTVYLPPIFLAASLIFMQRKVSSAPLKARRMVGCEHPNILRMLLRAALGIIISRAMRLYFL
jgi:hypothetical protein